MNALPLLLVFLGCTEPPIVTAAGDPCVEVNDRLGILACVNALPDRTTWLQMSLPAPAVDQERSGKWIAPAVADARLPETTIVNAFAFDLHSQFLAAAWPEAFPALDNQAYGDLVLYDDRELWSGKLLELPGGTYAFTVWDDAGSPDEAPTVDQIRARWEDLGPRVPGPLAFLPDTLDQQTAAEGWDDPGFPIVTGAGVAYEPYTTGIAYGTVRLYDAEGLALAEEAAAFGTTDVLVLEEAPFDVERPIAGAVTGTRQGQLSHLNVRSAARGTPNCFVQHPLDVFEPWTDQLVRFECGADGWDITPATLEEAEAHWASIRPDPVTVPAPDLGPTEPVPLLQLPTDTVDERAQGVAAYGAKGTQLATLYQRLDPAYQLEGFVVPMHHYDAFVHDTGWLVDLGDGPRWHSLADTLDAWLDDPDFVADGALRRARLQDLQAVMLEAPVDPDLVARLQDEVTAVFGSPDVMVRFRSSSNAEDALLFSGAGLYDSTSVCALDVPTDDVSACDPDRGDRSVERGLRTVWASLWGVAAFEEREWYGIDHRQVAMGVLVNTRSAAEQAEAVAFTGSPILADDRTWIDAQVGELGVVASEPGVFAEQTAVALEDGQVTHLERVRGSSELPGGEWVLDVERVTELAEVLADIEATFPLDEVPPADADVLLDTEWKVLADGRLVIKQIRPFLRSAL